MSEPDFRQMGDPLNDRLPPRRQWLQAGPTGGGRMSITDHLFIPQSRTSNMCVCGEPNTAHASVPTPVAPSFHMETNIGSIPVTLCACGLLMYQPMATVHMAKCESYRKTLRTETVR